MTDGVALERADLGAAGTAKPRGWTAPIEVYPEPVEPPATDGELDFDPEGNPLIAIL